MMKTTTNYDLIRFLAASRAADIWSSLSDEADFRSRGGRTIRDWEWLLNRCYRFNLMAIGGK